MFLLPLLGALAELVGPECGSLDRLLLTFTFLARQDRRVPPGRRLRRRHRLRVPPAFLPLLLFLSPGVVVRLLRQGAVTVPVGAEGVPLGRVLVHPERIPVLSLGHERLTWGFDWRRADWGWWCGHRGCWGKSIRPYRRGRRFPVRTGPAALRLRVGLRENKEITGNFDIGIR